MNIHSPGVLPGFETISRYWNAPDGVHAAKLLPGEYYLTRENEQLVTVVGSTVAVYAVDAKRSVAGLAHFALPVASTDRSKGGAYASHALDLLLGGLTRLGATRQNIRGLIVGGARVFCGRAGEARESVVFAREFLSARGVTDVGEVVGGSLPRKMWALPSGGCRPVVESLVEFNDTINLREWSYFNELFETWLEPGSRPGWQRSRLSLEARHIVERLNDFETHGADRRAWTLVSGISRLHDLLGARVRESEGSDLYVAMAEERPRLKSRLDLVRAQNEALLSRAARLLMMGRAIERVGHTEIRREVTELVEVLEGIEGAEVDLLQQAYHDDIGGES